MEAQSPRRRSPEPLGDILTQYLRRSRLLRPTRQQRLADAWCQVVGEAAARQTRIVGFKKNVLEVVVDSAPRLQELANFQKTGILLRLRDLLGSAYIRDIRFRPGSMSAGEVDDS